MSNSTSPSVFICYHHDDVARATVTFDQLRAAGADPWLDKRKLVLGDDWEHEIKKAVARADAFVVCLSSKFNDVGFRQKEVRWAQEALQLRPPGEGFIIPFLIEPCELPEWCRPFHAGNFQATSFDDLLIAVAKHTGYTFDRPEIRATNRLIDTLPFAEPEETVAIARSLGRLGRGNPRAVDALTSLLGNSNLETRLAAVSSLGIIGVQAARAVPALIATLDLHSQKALTSFATTIGRIGPDALEASETLLKILETEKDKDKRTSAYDSAAEALRSINATVATRSLLNDLRSVDVVRRRDVARMLRDLSLADETIIDSLVEAFLDEDSLVRHYAIEAVGTMGARASKAIPALVDAFSRSRDRNDAAKALGEMESVASSAIPVLIESVRSASESNYFVIGALGRIGLKSPEALTALCELIAVEVNASPRKQSIQRLFDLTTALARTETDASAAIPILKAALVSCGKAYERGSYYGFDGYLAFHHSPAWALAKLNPDKAASIEAIEAAAASAPITTTFLFELTRILEALRNGEPLPDEWI